jgi:hypothetical protein
VRNVPWAGARFQAQGEPDAIHRGASSEETCPPRMRACGAESAGPGAQAWNPRVRRVGRGDAAELAASGTTYPIEAASRSRPASAALHPSPAPFSLQFRHPLLHPRLSSSRAPSVPFRGGTRTPQPRGRWCPRLLATLFPSRRPSQLLRLVGVQSRGGPERKKEGGRGCPNYDVRHRGW